jgi:hypothetical protein
MINSCSCPKSAVTYWGKGRKEEDEDVSLKGVFKNLNKNSSEMGKALLGCALVFASEAKIEIAW